LSHPSAILSSPAIVEARRSVGVRLQSFAIEESSALAALALLASQISDSSGSLLVSYRPGRPLVVGIHACASADRLCDAVTALLDAHASEDGPLCIPDLAVIKAGPFAPAAARISAISAVRGLVYIPHGKFGGGLAVLALEGGHPLTDRQMKGLLILAQQAEVQLALQEALDEFRLSLPRLADPLSGIADENWVAELAANLRPAVKVHSVAYQMVARLEEAFGRAEDDAREAIRYSAASLACIARKVPDLVRDQPLPTGEKEEIFVRQMIDDALALLLKPDYVEIRIELQASRMLAHRAPLQQILLHLCSNALRYTAREGGVVHITLRDTPTAYYFYVADNGPGIPAPRLRRIFETLYGARDEAALTPGKVRPGLASVRSLAESLGGSIVVKSVEGEGTTFCLSLPKPAAE